MVTLSVIDAVVSPSVTSGVVVLPVSGAVDVLSVVVVPSVVPSLTGGVVVLAVSDVPSVVVSSSVTTVVSSVIA